MLFKYLPTSGNWILGLCSSLLSLQLAATPAVTESAVPTNQADVQTEPWLQRRYINESQILFTAGSGETIKAFAGYFEVPENRHNADSRLLKLHYVRFPARTATPGNPVVYLAGGPGGSGIHTAKGPRYSLFITLAADRDVIALDQRGTGLSADIAPCTSAVSVPQTKRLDEQQFSALHRQAVAECSQFWRRQGADPLGYTTIQNALDLDNLRQHLQAQQLTLWGISYGTHLALAASKLLGKHIDKMVLASVEGLDQTVKSPKQTMRYFEQLQQLAGAPKPGKPTLTALMQQVLTQLDKQPLLLRRTNADGQSTDFLFQRVHLQLLTSMSLADPNQRLFKLIQLYQGLAHQPNSMVKELSQLVSSGLFDGYAAGPIELRLMPVMMDLASGISASRLQLFEQQQQQSVLGGLLNFPMPHLANSVSNLDLGDDFRQEAKNTIPTLVLSGSLDGRTYPAEQQQAVAGLSARIEVTVQNAGHNLLEASPEVLTVIQQFLHTGKVSKQQIILPAPEFGL